MNNFEKWLVTYSKDIKKNFWCMLMKPFMKDAWRAALELVQKELAFGQTVAYSDVDVLTAVKKLIQKELNDVIPL